MRLQLYHGFPRLRGLLGHTVTRRLVGLSSVGGRVQGDCQRTRESHTYMYAVSQHNTTNIPTPNICGGGGGSVRNHTVTIFGQKCPAAQGRTYVRTHATHRVKVRKACSLAHLATDVTFEVVLANEKQHLGVVVALNVAQPPFRVGQRGRQL